MKKLIKRMLITLIQIYATLIGAMIFVHFAISKYQDSAFDFKIILAMPIVCFLIAFPINYYGYKKHNKI